MIVWIHGGGNVDGETPGYDGSKMAADGKTVVVTIEYRLNLMGFLAHPALDDEGHLFGNYGILDQQLVLKWVKRNIAKFGGDKNNVTLGGQSAGARRHRHQHGVAARRRPVPARRSAKASARSSPLPTLASAEATGVAFSVAAGCGSGTGSATAKCLRNLTAAQVEALAGTASAASQYVRRPDGGRHRSYPTQPITAFTNGQFNHVPLMNGNVEDEENFGLAITEYFSGPPRVPPTAAQYLNFVNTTYATPPYPAGTAAKVLAHYPLERLCEPAIGLGQGRDRPGDMRPSGRLDKLLAPQIPVYAYEFDDQTAPFYFPKMPGFLVARLPYRRHPVSVPALAWRTGPAEHDTLSEQEADGSLRSARRRLDELRLDRQPERARQLSLAALHEQHDQAGLADRRHSGPVDVDGPAVCCASQMRLLGCGRGLAS